MRTHRQVQTGRLLGIWAFRAVFAAFGLAFAGGLIFDAVSWGPGSGLGIVVCAIGVIYALFVIGRTGRDERKVLDRPDSGLLARLEGDTARPLADLIREAEQIAIREHGHKRHASR